MRIIIFWKIRKNLYCCWHFVAGSYDQLVAVADPGFPVGRRGPVRGVKDLRCRRFSVRIYAKMKELGPVGGM